MKQSGGNSNPRHRAENANAEFTGASVTPKQPAVTQPSQYIQNNHTPIQNVQHHSTHCHRARTEYRAKGGPNPGHRRQDHTVSGNEYIQHIPDLSGPKPGPYVNPQSQKTYTRAPPANHPPQQPPNGVDHTNPMWPPQNDVPTTNGGHVHNVGPSANLRYPFPTPRGNRSYNRNTPSYISHGGYIPRSNEPYMQPNTSTYPNPYTYPRYMDYSMDMPNGMYSAQAPQPIFTPKQQPVRRERKALDIINPATGAKIVDAKVVNKLANEKAENTVEAVAVAKNATGKIEMETESRHLDTKVSEKQKVGEPAAGNLNMSQDKAARSPRKVISEEKIPVNYNSSPKKTENYRSSTDIKKTSESDAQDKVIYEKSQYESKVKEKAAEVTIPSKKAAKAKGKPPQPIDGSPKQSKSAAAPASAFMFGTIAVPELEVPVPVAVATVPAVSAPVPVPSMPEPIVPAPVPMAAVVTPIVLTPAPQASCPKPVVPTAELKSPTPEPTVLPPAPMPSTPAPKEAETKSPPQSPLSQPKPVSEQNPTQPKPELNTHPKPYLSPKPIPVSPIAAQPETHIPNPPVKINGKFTYDYAFLTSLRSSSKPIPPPPDWPTMEITPEAFQRSNRSSRNTSYDREKRSNQSRPPASNPSQWNRQDNKRRSRNTSTSRSRPEQILDPLTLDALDRSDNRWVPTKSTTKLEQAQKQVQSILNKMTREKFDRLSINLASIEMESRETLESVIKIIFDKAISEPHFCDMYADLCVYLDQHWLSWPFLKVVRHPIDELYYWTVLSESDSDVVGPFTSTSDLLLSTQNPNVSPIPSPPSLILDDLVIHELLFVKVWKDTEQSLYFWSGEEISDLKRKQMMSGPFSSSDDAHIDAKKTCSFKRILLNSCQEEFEKDNIYEDLESSLDSAKKEQNLTSEMEAEFAEKRLLTKSRMLGNIRFIGELFRKGLLKDHIMKYCLNKLMDVHRVEKKGKAELVPVHPDLAPDEESIESLCKLLSTMGKDLEKRVGVDVLDLYYRFLENKLVKDKRLCSRINFMLRDVIDLRRNRWEPRRKELKNKTLTEIRKDAEREQRGAAIASANANQNPREMYRRPTNRPLQKKVFVDRSKKEEIKSSSFGRPAMFGGLSSKKKAPSPVPKEESESIEIPARAKSIAKEYAQLLDADEAETRYIELVQENEAAKKTFALEILKFAVDAKDKDRIALFDLLRAWHAKNIVASDVLRSALLQMIQLACELWCDVPKLHEHLATFASYFVCDHEKTSWTIYSFMSGDTYDSIEMEEIIISRFLPAFIGTLLQSLNEATAKVLARDPRICYWILFPDQRSQKFMEWLEKYKLQQVIPLNYVCVVEEMLCAKRTKEEIVEYLNTIPPSLMRERFFAAHASAMILARIEPNVNVSADESMLLTGLFVDVAVETQFIANVVQMRHDYENLTQLLFHLMEDNTLHLSALQAWLEMYENLYVREKAMASMTALYKRVQTK